MTSEPKRRKPLPRSTKPIKTTRIRVKEKSTQKKAEMSDAREKAFTRAGDKCEANWVGCTQKAVHAHHRRMRSQGGLDTASNLLAVCERCHNAIHANPSEAYELGHLLRYGDKVD